MGLEMSDNKFIYDVVNKATYATTLAGMKVDLAAVLDVDETTEPLWITGMFRSGTSITARIVKAFGASLGADSHLLQAKGWRKELNPEGFFENYLFMDLSMYIFKQLDAWGDSPPDPQRVAQFDLNSIDHKDFCKNSIVEFHDDRISNIDMQKVLTRYSAQTLDAYFEQEFGGFPAVKNPHFCLLAPVLDRYWPGGRYLVVFRNPKDTLRSALKVTPRASYDLYDAYYSRMKGHPNAIFFSHDNLVADPIGSIRKLADSLDFTANAEALNIPIKASANKEPFEQEVPGTTQELYDWMSTNAINKLG